VAPAGESSARAGIRIGIAIFDAHGVLAFTNPGFPELLGLGTDHVKPGISFAALLDQLARTTGYDTSAGASFLCAQAALDRKGSAVLRHERADGKLIEIASEPLPDGGWSMTVADISQLARAEKDAHARAQLLDTILAAIPHGICVYGADDRVAMTNPAYLEIMEGAPVAIGEHRADIFRRRVAAGELGPGDPDEILARLLAIDVTRPQRRTRPRPNGMVLDVRTAPLPDGGHVSVVTDVTPLTRAEAELSRHAEHMGTMLSSIRHGILFWGPDRRLIASNRMAAELLGHSPDLLQPGRTEDELLDDMVARNLWGEADTPRMAENLRNRDRSVPYRRYLRTQAGRTLEAWSEPVPGGGWISTVTDVTDQVTGREELKTAKETAEAANQAKSRFLATMSHELRTPLNAVIGFSDALLREGRHPAPGRVSEFAQQINDAGRQLLNLINIILDVARIEAGRFDLAVDRVDIGTLIREAIRNADAAAQAAEITLVAELPEDLPILRADERRLQQVLGHLLSNAVKFTDAGGTVTVGASIEPDGALLIYVRDTGIGIPQEDLERVFEPFTQLDSTLSRRFQGAGIGLYVARALVAGHGGRLQLRSLPGSGTIAEVRLPPEHLV
jgi:signal transduction histidine kinase